MESVQAGRTHRVEMENCKILKVSGVQEVISFDDTLAVLVTPCGTLQIEGEGLHVTMLNLEQENIALDGSITAFYYTKVKEKGSKGFGRR
jgi:sporulation protein YabP